MRMRTGGVRPVGRTQRGGRRHAAEPLRRQGHARGRKQAQAQQLARSLTRPSNKQGCMGACSEAMKDHSQASRGGAVQRRGMAGRQAAAWQADGRMRARLGAHGRRCTGGRGSGSRGCTLLKRGEQACPPPLSPKVMSSRGRVCASGSRRQRALQSSAQVRLSRADRRCACVRRACECRRAVTGVSHATR